MPEDIDKILREVAFEEEKEIMPIPNHCIECDKPIQDLDRC